MATNVAGAGKSSPQEPDPKSKSASTAKSVAADGKPQGVDGKSATASVSWRSCDVWQASVDSTFCPSGGSWSARWDGWSSLDAWPAIMKLQLNPANQ